MANSTLVFFDLETTGFSAKKNGVHEIGLTTLYGDEYDIRLKPYGVADPIALKVCNKTLEEVNAYPSEEEGANRFTEALTQIMNKHGKPVRLIGYCNKTMDNRFVLPLLGRNGLYAMARRLVISSLDLREGLRYLGFKDVRGLAIMAWRLGIPVEENKLHGALYDAKLTAEVYKRAYNWKP